MHCPLTVNLQKALILTIKGKYLVENANKKFKKTILLKHYNNKNIELKVKTKRLKLFFKVCLEGGRQGDKGDGEKGKKQAYICRKKISNV